MEKEKTQVVTSKQFDDIDLPEIHDYGCETFGLAVADLFVDNIYKALHLLKDTPYVFPECRHLPTKTQKYRNIILGSYLIIYRITAKRVEMLRALHGSQYPKIIKHAKRIKI